MASCGPTPRPGILKIAAFDRRLRTDDLFVGFVRGYGLRSCAVASTMTWDSQCLVAIGSNDRDLALAVDRLVDTQGGVAVTRDGELLADFEVSPVGPTSLEPLPVVAAAVREVRETLQKLGCPWPI